MINTLKSLYGKALSSQGVLLNYTTGYVFLLLHGWLYHQNDHTLASSREVNLIFQPVNQSEQVSTDHRGNDFPIVVPSGIHDG